MIEKLTKEQEALLDEVAEKYENTALGGDDSIDPTVIKESIDWLYSLIDLQPPEIVVCPSPGRMVREAKLPQGSNYDYIGQGYDAGWTAFYDYMEQIGVDYDPKWGFDKWKRFITESGVWATVFFEKTAYVCKRPCVVNRDENYDLHCDGGPAIAWADGYSQWYLHGTNVPREIAETPAAELDPAIVMKQENAEVRSEGIRKVGYDRLMSLLEGKVIDSQPGEDEYALLQVENVFDEPMKVLRMRCPSSGDYHYIPVDPECATVGKALSFYYGGRKYNFLSAS